MNNVENQVIITVSGKDKVGIVASVSNALSKYNVKVSKIPIGIPMGTDIEYIDTMTLEMAFEDRKDVA